MNYCAIIATHHKTGTVWMYSIFRRIAKVLGLHFINIRKSAGLDRQSLVVPSIIFNDHSEFTKCRWLPEHPRSRILHLIRDPRDIVLSAMHHHRTAAEAWLHKPLRAFDMLTYQEKLNSLPDDQSRYLFEMQNSARRIITDMRNWNYQRPNAIECRYEEMIADADLLIFDKVLSHLGFDADECEAAKLIIRSNSLFGEIPKKRLAHVRSGQARQWKDMFNTELAKEFLARFGDVLIELGYEADNSWVAPLRSHAHPSSAVRTVGSPNAQILSTK